MEVKLIKERMDWLQEGKPADDKRLCENSIINNLSFINSKGGFSIVSKYKRTFAQALIILMPGFF